MALSLSCWIQSEIVELWLSRSCDVCVPRCRWEIVVDLSGKWRGTGDMIFFIYLIEKCSRALSSTHRRAKRNFISSMIDVREWKKWKKKISNKNFRFWFTTSIFGARFLLLYLRVSRSKHNTNRDDTTTAWERSQNFNCLIFTTFQFYTDAFTLPC